MRKQLLVSTAILLFLAIGTVLVVLYGRGYQFGFDRGKIEISGTGLLVTTSIPDGASVFINDKLVTATDDTLNLFPGDYTIKIVKEGYFPWEKRINVQKEIVAKADATLYPLAPQLQSITSSGVNNPVIDPSMTKLAYTVASSSASKNGVYVLDMTTRLILTLQSASTQITDDSTALFSTSSLSWSPSGQELLATVSAPLATRSYLLDADGYNNNPQDVSATLDSVESVWAKEKEEADTARLATLKKETQKIVSTNMKIASWSPDETRILYTASNSATLPIAIKPRLVGIEATPEKRELEKGKWYVYDIKEDKNYALPIASTDSSQSVSWMPDSKHVLYAHDRKIDIMDFDGTNSTTIFAGPFLKNYVFPWPNGNKVVILTNLGNENTSPNLYTIDLE